MRSPSAPPGAGSLGSIIRSDFAVFCFSKNSISANGCQEKMGGLCAGKIRAVPAWGRLRPTFSLSFLKKEKTCRARYKRERSAAGGSLYWDAGTLRLRLQHRLCHRAFALANRRVAAPPYCSLTPPPAALANVPPHPLSALEIIVNETPQPAGFAGFTNCVPLKAKRSALLHLWERIRGSAGGREAPPFVWPTPCAFSFGPSTARFLFCEKEMGG